MADETSPEAKAELARLASREPPPRSAEASESAKRWLAHYRGDHAICAPYWEPPGGWK
jgi:hypothetical protein